MVQHTIAREAPLFLIDAAVGLVGFLLSLGWGKSTGREMDRDTVLFLAKMWGGIAIFGTVIAFVV